MDSSKGLKVIAYCVHINMNKTRKNKNCSITVSEITDVKYYTGFSWKGVSYRDWFQKNSSSSAKDVFVES